jgi:hypothetical protein
MIGKKQNRHSNTLTLNEYAESEEVPKVFTHFSPHPPDSHWQPASLGGTPSAIP